MELNSLRNSSFRMDTDSITKSLEETNLPLKECMDDNSRYFLTYCGVYWSNKPFYLPIIWDIIVILFVFIFYFMEGPFYFTYYLVTAGFDVFELFQLGFIIQGIAMIFIIIHAHQRINQTVKKADLFVFPIARRIAFLTYLIFITTFTPAIVWIFAESFPTYFVVFLLLGLLGSSAMISVNLFFLLVDAKVCMSLLSTLVSQDIVTLDEYKAVKQEIDDRISKNQLNNTIVMTVAIGNVMIVLLMFIIDEHVASKLEIILELIAGMSREILYVLIGFWYVALVNEKSLELRMKLSEKVLQTKSDDIEGKGHLVTVLAVTNANPISFPLAGMVLTRKDIIFRFILWLIGLFIGIARQKF